MAWRGEAHLALSGGRTPAALHRVLASLPFDGWSHVHVWFGDERTVPPAHADSNYRMARETLLSAVPIPEPQVHRWEAELGPGDAASRYDAALRDLATRQERSAPAFDLLLLGMGADAHTASLFPGSPLLAGSGDGADPAATFATAVEVPKLNTWRLTVTPATIRAARTVFVLVVGADKHAGTSARPRRRARSCRGSGDAPARRPGGSRLVRRSRRACSAQRRSEFAARCRECRNAGLPECRELVVGVDLPASPRLRRTSRGSTPGGPFSRFR